MLWVLKRTVSEHITKENICNFTLKNFVYLYLCGIMTSVNPFMPNGISHHYDLDEPISNCRAVELYFSFLMKF